MLKKELPIPLTQGESIWGNRYLLFQMVFLGSIIRLALAYLYPAATSAHVNFVFFLTNFLAVGWIFRHYLLNSIKFTGKNLPGCLIGAVVGFVAYQALSRCLSVLISILYPDFYNVNDASLSATAQGSFVLMAVGTVLLVPIVEETLYRGLVFGLLHRRSRIGAYIVSALLFCAIHVMSYIGYYEPLQLLICFVQYLPAGLVLAWVYEYSGSIFAPTLIHMAVNTIGILSMR